MITGTIEDSVFRTKDTTIVGDVTIGENSSVWYHAVIRGDASPIVIGKETNIQDNCTLHTGEEGSMIIGDRVTVGHNVILHGCEIGNDTLIGMGSIIMDGAKIGSNCIIGAGSLVTQGKEIPDGTMAFGNPAKPIRELTKIEMESIQASADEYLYLSKLELQEKFQKENG